MQTRKLKLVVAYDGAAYSGWQVQKVGTGVQEKLEWALAQLFPSGPRAHSSSRTDTGVHALGMVVHFEIPAAELKMTPEKLRLAVNAHLPDDVRVMSAARCHRDFHARFDAAGKQYRYFIWNHHAHHPLLRHQSWLVHKPLSLPRMKEAARMLLGKHDFGSFAATRDYKMESTVRTLQRCEIQKKGSLLTFIIEADGFLYKMCRGIVGTLAQVGEGKFEPGDIPRILEGKDRRVAGMTAPAKGLVLWKVFYRSRKEPRPPKPGAEEDE